MTLLRILALSILLGGCTAFFIWYAWGIGANVAALRRGRAVTVEPDEPEAEES